MRKLSGLSVLILCLSLFALSALAHAENLSLMGTSTAVLYLPIVAKQPTPTRTPTPTATPVTPGGYGILGSLILYTGCGHTVCFVETITNTTGNTITYSYLGVKASNLSGGPSPDFHTSWSGDLALDPYCIGPTDRCKGPWADGMDISPAGTYRLSLDICYRSSSECTSGQGWVTLDNHNVITVASAARRVRP